MAPTDTSLIKVVHRETIVATDNTTWTITANLTRFGGLCVLVTAVGDDDLVQYQGENIIEARNWARS